MSKAAKKQKFYVVWKGRKTGVFDNWNQTDAQVKAFTGAQYKAYESRSEAEKAFKAGFTGYAPKSIAKWKQGQLLGVEPPLAGSYSVDAACNGSPGELEYRGVETETGKELFRRGPFPEGTNNIGEFLAIVEALRLLRDLKSDAPIYSDSENALSWVKQKKCKTQLVRNARNADLFQEITRAEAWLRGHTYTNKVLKWRTDEWGENPADYGRK